MTTWLNTPDLKEMIQYTMTRNEVLIVGQGIAGTVMAHTLYNHSVPFTIIDDGHKTSSSVAAGGMYNPLVLKRLLKSWDIDNLLPFAKRFYSEVEQTLGLDIIQSINNYRKIAQPSELEQWLNKKDQEDYIEYVGDIIPSHIVNDKIVAKYGYGMVKNAGKVNLDHLLNGSKSFFSEHIIHERFDYEKLIFEKELCRYNDTPYTSVIFCEGYKVKDNPFFSTIEMKPVKGENLVVRIPGLDLEHVIKSSIYILPLGDNLYHIGSTYDWNNLNEKPSAEARETLLTKLKTIIHLPIDVVDHKAGVRPSSKDRRPVIGQSTDHHSLYLLNGLGAKGIMLSPYYSEQLFQNIYHNLPINDVVNLSRFSNKKN